MKKDKIYEVLQPERLRSWLRSAFEEVGITSTEILKDEEKVKRAAKAAYKKILFSIS